MAAVRRDRDLARTRHRAKGSIRQVKPAGPTVYFHYDPAVFNVTRDTRWETIERPRRVDAIEWVGAGAARCTFTLLLDGYPDRSVERDIATLEAMKLPAAVLAGNTAVEPPRVRVSYAEARDILWVLTEVTPGDAQIRLTNRQRCRQDLSLTLVEYVSADVILTPVQRAAAKSPTAAAPKAPAPAKPRTYSVKRGDTLWKIAHALLGNGARWKEIYTLNRKVIGGNPNLIKPGQTFRLP